MRETVKLEQKRADESYEAELTAGEVRYRSVSKRGEGSAAVPYELVSRKTSTYTRANPFFRNAAVYFAILTVATVGFGFLVDLDGLIAILWAAVGAGCYLVYRVTGVEYEVFPLADGRVFRLIRDNPSREEYERFRDTLFERRDAYLLDRYARIDVERPARLERRRIDWLHDEGVIDETAYVTIVETIEENAQPS